MRTVRYDVYETNSSSCHVVTILSDREYKDIAGGRAFLTSDGDVKTITNDSVKEYIDNSIKDSEETIEYTKKNIEKLLPLRDKDTGDWTEDERRLISYAHQRMNGTQLKAGLEMVIDTRNDSLKELENDLKKYQSIDHKRMTELLTKVTAEYFEDITDDDISYEELIEKSDGSINGLSEQDFIFIRNYVQDWYNLRTFGAGYEEYDESERTIDGVTVHVLSYSGYNG